MIVDEVHAVAGTKRGAHLALSLERLDAPARAAGPADRAVGDGPPGRGGRPVPRRRPRRRGRAAAVGQDRSSSRSSSRSRTCAELGQSTGEVSGSAAGEERRTSIWPHVEERIVDLVEAHRSTIVFANSRRLAERLCARLNEIALASASTGERLPRGRRAAAGPDHGAVRGLPRRACRSSPGPTTARCRKEQRGLIEEDLKAGRLPAVVATSSLELGIDMGAVDLVVQVESPPSVASGLQRVGRAGHQVGAVSRGVIFPKYRGDLVQTAVVAERMRAGADRGAALPPQPARRARPADRRDGAHGRVGRRGAVRRGAPGRELRRAAPQSAFDAVLDMLAGRYPSDEFAELRPRLVWDRVAGTLTGRPGAQRLAVTSGGTIPDRGLFGVFLVGETRQSRVGELDEEMVYESRVGDVFTLGSTSWRIEDITHDQVLVTPAPGQPGRLPFWKGDALGRPVELGRALGAFVRELGGLTPAQARARVLAAGLDDVGRRQPAGLPATSSARPPATCPTTARSSSSGSATSSATGGSRSTRRSARRCTRRGRWPSPPGCASATASTCRRCTPTTASCCGCPTSSSTTRRCRRERTDDRPCSPPTRSSRWSPPRSAGRRCSRPGSASARPAPCCCPGATPAGARRCGSSGSGPPSCCRWPATTARSRSCSRRCASACRTSSTCRAWSA